MIIQPTIQELKTLLKSYHIPKSVNSQIRPFSIEMDVPHCLQFLNERLNKMEIEEFNKFDECLKKAKSWFASNKSRKMGSTFYYYMFEQLEEYLNQIASIIAQDCLLNDTNQYGDIML